MDLSCNDLDAVTRTMLAEAGENATPASQAAIANVIRNRLAAGGYGRSPSEIVHAPYQFSPWNSGSGNDPTRFGADSPAYKQAEALAQGVFTGTVADHTNGATHFYAPAAQAANNAADPAHNPLVPSFARGQPLAEIGGHQFFAPSGPVTPGNAPGGPETATPYSGPGSQPTPGNLPAAPAAPANGQSQLAALLGGMQRSQGQGGGGGGGLLGGLLFGRQGIMGLFPQQIQDKGIVGSIASGMGSPGPAPAPAGGGLLQRMFAGGGSPSVPRQPTGPMAGLPTTPADWAGTRADFAQRR